MNIYNIDGIPGITVSGKQAGENIIIKKTAKRGRMTFYSSNVYNGANKNSSLLNNSIFKHAYVINNNVITNDITFLSNDKLPQDYDLLIENQKNKLNLYLIFCKTAYKNIESDDETINDNTYNIPTDYYELKLIDSLSLSSFSQESLDLNISVSSTNIMVPSWPGYYKLSYLNRKSELIYKSYTKSAQTGLNNPNVICSKFSYTDSSNNVVPRTRQYTNPFSYYEEHDNYIKFVNKMFNYDSYDDMDINYGLLVNKLSEPLCITKKVKNDNAKFKGIYIKLHLKDTNTHALINDIDINKISLNCDVLYNYNIPLNDSIDGLKRFGFKFVQSEGQNGHIIELKRTNSENTICPYGVNDLSKIIYTSTYEFNRPICENGIVSLFISKDDLAKLYINESIAFYALSPIYASIEPKKYKNIYNDTAFLLNDLSLLSDTYNENDDTYTLSYEVYVSYDIDTSLSVHTSKVRIDSNIGITNYMYNFGDLPYFDTTKISNKDYSIDASLISKIDVEEEQKESFLNLPAFSLNDNNTIKERIDKIDISDKNVNVISFTISSLLPDMELNKYQIIAEFDNTAFTGNVFKCNTSTCLENKWETVAAESDVFQNIHPNGDMSMFDGNLNFNNENIFPCTFIVKEFDDKFKNNIFNKTINLPIEIADKCIIKLFAYYKKSLNDITKIYLGETAVTATYIR